MKKLVIVLLVSVLGCGCSVTLKNPVMSHDYASNNLKARIDAKDYKVVRTVEGKATATYIFGIGGHSSRARKIYASSYDDMVRNANLKANQAIIGVQAETRHFNIFGCVYIRNTVHTTGRVVEFEDCTVQQPAVSESVEPIPITTPVATPVVEKVEERTENVVLPSQQPKAVSKILNVGDIYTVNGITGVVFEVFEGGLHGKIVYPHKKFFGTWNVAVQACIAVGAGWRLPNEEEMETILVNFDKINAAIPTIGSDVKSLGRVDYWTSTQLDNQYIRVLFAWANNDFDREIYLARRSFRYVAVAEF